MSVCLFSPHSHQRSVTSSQGIILRSWKVSETIENLLFDHKGDVFLIPVTFFLVLLSLTFLISFLGCCSSCLANRCLMAMVGIHYFSKITTFLEGSQE